MPLCFSDGLPYLALATHSVVACKKSEWPQCFPLGSREGLCLYLLVGKVWSPRAWHHQNASWHSLTGPETNQTHYDVRDLNRADPQPTVLVVSSGPRDDSLPSEYCTVG
jgi:hypothetical protein